MSGLSEQLAEIRELAERAAARPFFFSDCEGVLKIWALSALEHVIRDDAGTVTGWSEPGSYRAADLVAEVELDMGSWDPGEDEDDDQRRQDFGDLVASRELVPALLARVAELEQRLAARPEHELGAEWAERLTAMRARADAATEGPWCTDSWEIYQGAEYVAGAMWIGETCRGGTTTLDQDRADAAFVAAAREDVPALLDLLDQALSVLRQHQDWHARDAMRMEALEADASAQVPQLREAVTAWSKRAREAKSETEALRIRNAELEARAAGPVTTWFLADSEGAEGGPTLHATLDAAKAWCDGFEQAEWFEQDGVWVQCTCDPDTDRPTGRGAGTVTPLAVPADAEGGERS